MWHVLCRVVGRTKLRHLDCARVLASTKKSLTAEVAHLRSIDDYGVVVQSRNKGRRRDHPVAVRLFLHIHLRPAPEIHLDLRGVGSFETDLRPSRAVNSRVFSSPHICCGRIKSPASCAWHSLVQHRLANRSSAIA